MTAAPPSPNGIERIVRQYRTRVRTVLFARAAVVTGALAAAAAGAWNLLSNTTPESAGATVVAAIAAGLMMSMLFALHRTPTLHDTADLIDDRLDARNHVAAALQLSRDESAMAILVVRGALGKLSSTTPADVFPMRITRPIAVAALSVTFALLTSVRGGTPLPYGIAGDTGGGAREAASETSVADGDTPGVSARPTATAASQSAALRDDQPGIARERGAGAHEDRPAAPADVSYRDTNGLDSDEIVREAAGLKRDPASGLERAGQPRGSGAPGGDGLTLEPVARAAAAGTAPSGTGLGTGTSMTAAEGQTSQAGGVSLDARHEPASASSSPLTRQRLASTVAAARTQATMAMTNDDIPPALRRYVRDYFLRLQASGRRR